MFWDMWVHFRVCLAEWDAHICALNGSLTQIRPSAEHHVCWLPGNRSDVHHRLMPFGGFAVSWLPTFRSQNKTRERFIRTHLLGMNQQLLVRLTI